MTQEIIKETFTPNQQSGIRIDKLLAENFANVPRENFKKAIKNGDVLVNGKKIKPNYVTGEHDKIEINIIFEKKIITALPDSSVEINVIYQHPDFLIIEKPSRISAHPSDKERLGTLANGLLSKFPQTKNVGENPLRPGSVHRLDKYTSGILIVPLTQPSFDFFKLLFKNRQISKKYTAVCWGIPDKEEGIIESFIGRSHSNPLKQATSKNSNKVGNAKKAITEYRLLKKSSDETKSLILATLKTGRKHQIRVHLQSIGNPVVGDKMYQPEKLKIANQDFTRFLLHASNLSFTYSDGKKYQFESPLPKQFTKFF